MAEKEHVLFFLLLLFNEGMNSEYEAVGAIRIASRKKPAPVTLCSPQIPHDMTWCRNACSSLCEVSIIVAWF
jgi:hypothetical protein